MAGHLDPAPAVGNPAARVDQEGAAFDAEHLAAVHVLFLDHRKRLAQRLVLVADQRKTKALFGAEVVVRFDRIARARKSVVEGKGVSVSVDPGGRRIIKNKKTK